MVRDSRTGVDPPDRWSKSKTIAQSVSRGTREDRGKPETSEGVLVACEDEILYPRPRPYLYNDAATDEGPRDALVANSGQTCPLHVVNIPVVSVVDWLQHFTFNHVRPF